MLFTFLTKNGMDAKINDDLGDEGVKQKKNY
jgi:hypothetical protein